MSANQAPNPERESLSVVFLGSFLAPKDQIWEPLMEGRPGMSVLRVEDFRPGPPPVRVWATIEPVREPHPPYRFQIQVNWHGDIQLESPDGANATEMASRFMVSEWDKVRDFGTKLADRIFAVLHRSIP